MKRAFTIFLFIFLSALSSAFSETLILDGLLNGKMEVRLKTNFHVDRPLTELKYRFALPSEFSNKTVAQRFTGLTVTYDPQPVNIEEETDRFGNHFMNVTWKNIKQGIEVNIAYTTEVKAELPALMSTTPFPIKGLPDDIKTYFKPAEMIQSDNEEILLLSKRLTHGCTTEYCAVTAIMNFVADNIKYTHNPAGYDAPSTLQSRSGNCTNIAHLSIALLKAAGIPCRMVGGIGLKERWSIPSKEGNLIQGLGQGYHAWIEVYFPDLGWLSYDPQQSKQFTSTRHVKRTHGLQLDDIADRWWGTPYAPRSISHIEERFFEDVVSLKVTSSEKMPKTSMLSNYMTARLEAEPIKETKPYLPEPKKPPEPAFPVEPVKPPEKVSPPALIKPPEPPLPVEKPEDKEIILGNMDFPALIDVYRIIGNEGMVIFDMETAEYVTSKYIYAQAFNITEPMLVKGISLAMKKFGGDGALYIDLVKDEKGKPGLTGVRSNLLFLENIPKRTGYYWVDFDFPIDVKPVLTKGKYWIVVRHSGEAIMNWFYTPRKLYGGPYDTRSTLKGYTWEDILNYDFVFKVKGERL